VCSSNLKGTAILNFMHFFPLLSNNNSDPAKLCQWLSRHEMRGNWKTLAAFILTLFQKNSSVQEINEQ
jgi:hypothetical protein